VRKKLLISVLFILILGLITQLKLQKIFGLKPSPEKNYKIRIGCSSLTPIHCMFGEIFKRTQILAKYGLDGKITFFLHGSDQAEACKKNKIDATFSCEVPAIYHLVEFPYMRIVGTPGSLGRIALIVPKESNIFSVKDLKNKRILVHSGSSAMMMIHKWLGDSQLVPDRDVDLIPTGKDLILNKLYDEKAEAAVSWDPWLEIFLKKHDFRIIRQRPFYSVIFISQRYMEEFPHATTQYIAALREALFWATKHKELVCKWVSEGSGLETNTVKNVMDFNENWLLAKSKKNIDLCLSQEVVKILKECSEFVRKIVGLPKDFDVIERINLNLSGDEYAK